VNRTELRAAAGFLLGAACAVVLAVLYWRGGQPQLEGALLGIAFAGVGYGFVTWANRLLPQGPHTEPRPPLGHDEASIDDDLAVVGRRRLLVRALGLAVGGLGIAALFPIRSLGPRPGRSLLRTDWRLGVRLVGDDGRPVRATDVPLDGLVTVFPEGHAGSADGQAVLMRVPQQLIRANPERLGWSPEGFIAYSKVCTHAGCPVGLYQADTHQLLCPCHQSAFDVLDGARAVSGPAAWPLPQLPLQIDNDGFLIAAGDFSEPVGPGYWRAK
jgi:ubiquinol-cytochrome c reductase iron-sulfur subunit